MSLEEYVCLAGFFGPIIGALVYMFYFHPRRNREDANSVSPAEEGTMPTGRVAPVAVKPGQAAEKPKSPGKTDREIPEPQAVDPSKATPKDAHKAATS